MGSLILCHDRQAKHPYEITRIHKKIYTIEELCYYICNYLYLVDFTVVNHQLCNWLDQELGLTELAAELRVQLSRNVSLEQFLLTILESSNIYTASEVNRIEGILEQLKNQKDVEREKYKGDALLGNGEYDAAILVYRQLLEKDWDESMPKDFYGRIYANIGSCYGRLFLYEEAAKQYKEAVSLTDDPDVLRAFIYSCRRAYPHDEYVKMLSNNAKYLSVDGEIRDIVDGLKDKIDTDVAPERLKTLRKEYRKIDK